MKQNAPGRTSSSWSSARTTLLQNGASPDGRQWLCEKHVLYSQIPKSSPQLYCCGIISERRSVVEKMPVIHYSVL